MKWFWKILAGVGAVCSAVFYVLFIQAKEKRLVEERNNAQEKADNLETSLEKSTERRKENAELVDKILDDSNADKFTDSVNLLHKCSEEGRERNKN